eukprot:3390962-Amphidinium_carterae.2
MLGATQNSRGCHAERPHQNSDIFGCRFSDWRGLLRLLCARFYVCSGAEKFGNNLFCTSTRRNCFQQQRFEVLSSCRGNNTGPATPRVMADLSSILDVSSKQEKAPVRAVQIKSAWRIADVNVRVKLFGWLTAGKSKGAVLAAFCHLVAVLAGLLAKISG